MNKGSQHVSLRGKKFLLKEIDVSQGDPMIMHCDNAKPKERFNVLIQLLDEHRIIPISIPLAKRSRARALSSSDDGALPVG
ncbi:UNVERIFIED_CONTAM: hypothetical protein Slati_4574500 [Sesamum latifolium]|uniref:Uncharacterized protein n=1 Tax=Sesamum latifolium TaxID=2727402 RepID=A0AAW2SGS1_9LAMI